MTTERWRNIPTKEFVLLDLIPTQGHVYHHHGGSSYCGDPLPHVVEYKGKFYLDDGHHRVVAAIARGDETIVARHLAV